MKIKNSTPLISLFTEYPQLEEIITDYLPELLNLEQAQLRDQVLAHTTIEHIALKAGQEPSQVIVKLKKAAGIADDISQPDSETIFSSPDPDWVRGVPKHKIDGVAMLSRGDHPLDLVKNNLNLMAPGEVILLTTNFHPQPMIDAMLQQGAEVYSRSDLQNGDLHLTFIKK